MRRNRMVTTVSVAFAAGTLFLDVHDFAGAAHITVTTDHASARQSRKAKKSNDAHVNLQDRHKASSMPHGFRGTASRIAGDMGVLGGENLRVPSDKF